MRLNKKKQKRRRRNIKGKNKLRCLGIYKILRKWPGIPSLVPGKQSERKWFRTGKEGDCSKQASREKVFHR